MSIGNAYPPGHLVPSPFFGLVHAPIAETRFPELVSFLDFSPWIIITPRYFLNFHNTVNDVVSIEILNRLKSVSVQCLVTFWCPWIRYMYKEYLKIKYTHPITGFNDDSACVTTKTAGRIAEDGLVVLNIIYMVYNIFHALTLRSVHFLYNTWIVYQI